MVQEMGIRNWEIEIKIPAAFLSNRDWYYVELYF